MARVMQGAARQWRVSTVVMSKTWGLALGMTSSNNRRGSRGSIRRRGACRLTSMRRILCRLRYRLWKEKRTWGRRACSQLQPSVLLPSVLLT
jgi:hypothetical protein